MPSCDLPAKRIARRAAGAVLVLALAVLSAEVAQGQNFNGNYGRSVGGVSIDAEGMLTKASVDEQGRIRRLVAEAVDKAPDGLKKSSGLRKVSLARLDAAIQKSLADGHPLSSDMLCLAGLQQIRFVLVYPDQKDIVLAGPGEGWKIDARGNIVGETTDRPVMLLDDLLVALRASLSPSRAVISCSIDPTAEGLARLTRMAKKLGGADPQGAARAVEQQLGPQKVSFTGVPETSHFAHVLVAADYRMKRISMGLEPAPVPGLPSFLQLMKAGSAGMRNMLPRWWLAPGYDPLLRDPDGLAWEIRGARVKAMAENDFFNEAGAREKTAAADPVSQRWADSMTRRYEDLAKAEPVFAQLRNCIDLAIVGALVAKENLIGKAGCILPLLTDSALLEALKLPAPKQIESKAALIRKGKWMIAAGGVQINPWDLVEKAQASQELGDVRVKAAASSDTSWWWD